MHPITIEPLERRVLLAGVTLLTHGFDSSVAGWVTAVADAMEDRVDSGEVTRYTLDVFDPGDEGTADPLAWSLSSRSGPDPATSAEAEIQILLNWADIAEHLALGSEARTSDELAEFVVPLLRNASLIPELGMPLASLPFHLIGHSRGASLVSELAREMGQSGLWVEQVTFLDANDLWDDSGFFFVNEPEAQALGNTIFVDNYYQQTSNGIPDGVSIPNAYNRRLTNLDDLEYDNDNNHSDVPLWYFGTVDLATPAILSASNRVTSTMRNLWWTDAEQQGAHAGFHYSRIDDGVRPASGLLSAFGGSASRSTPSRSGVQWPNVGGVQLLAPSTATLTKGKPASARYRFGDADSSSSVTLYLDSDRNPFNNAGLAPRGAASHGSTVSITVAEANLDTSDIASGDYFLLAVTTDGARSRFAYASDPVALVDPAPQVISQRFDVDTDRQQVVFTFDQDVAASLDAADLELVNHDTGQTIAAAMISASFDPVTRTATFRFPGFANGVLPDGNYTAMLHPEAIENRDGIALQPAASLDFFTLAADANRDRSVNFTDFLILRGNFGRTNNPLFSEADFNYDDRVDFADFLILRGQFGMNLPPPSSGSLFADAGSGGGGGEEDQGVLPR